MNEFTLTIGAEVNSLDSVPNNLSSIQIQPAKYAVFSIKGIAPIIQKAWDNICMDWIRKSKYSMKSLHPNFETYEESWTRLEPGYVHIHIALE
ncbi:MAG: effector binding domain-containing protein [Spirochaetes bacterium]|nr:effector binding domain-containing protein [Spirochaetota bacterium]